MMGLDKIRSFFMNDRKRLFIVALVFLFFALLGYSYRQLAYQVEHSDYQIFDFSEKYSWRNIENGIFRISNFRDYETTLLTKDDWKEFTLFLDIINPSVCAITFGFKNPNNAHILYFNPKEKFVKWAHSKQLGLPAKTVPVVFSNYLKLRLEVREGQAKLFLYDSFLTSLKVEDVVGRVGIISNEVTMPPTFFHNVRIDGITAKGEHIVTGAPSAKKAYPNYFPSLVLFYFLLLVLSAGFAYSYKKYYLDARLNYEKIEEKKGCRPGWVWPLALHLGITIFLFWPFVSKGHILVSSSDNYGEIFPLFLLSKHNFMSLLKGGSLYLWNPYAHNGIPFFSNHWKMIYYPLNWLVFLVQDKNVFTALTLRTFVEVFLTGLCAYGFFFHELKSRRWALLSSVTYQMCSFLIFSLSVFPAISTYFSMTLFLYFVWSIPQRKNFWNYLGLSLAAYFLLTSANVAFIFYSSIALIVIFLYRLYSLRPDKREQRRTFGIVLGSAVTGFLVAAIRLIPCAIGILKSNRIVEGYCTLHDRLFLITRLFVPEISGWHDFNLLTTPKTLAFVYELADLPSNPQNAFFVYFGIIPAVFVLLNLFIRVPAKHAFWRMYSFVVLGIGLLFQPIWGVFSVLIYPLLHYSYHTILIPIGICTLVGYTGLYLEKQEYQISHMKRAWAGLLACQILIVVIVTYAFPAGTNRARWIFLGVGAWFALYYALKNIGEKGRKAFVRYSLIVFEVLLWAAVLSIVIALFKNPIITKINSLQFLFLPLLILLVAIFGGLRRVSGSDPEGKKRSWGDYARIAMPYILGPAVFLGLLKIRLVQNFLCLENPSIDIVLRNYFLFLFSGEVRFLAVVAIVFTLIYLYQRKMAGKKLVFYAFFILLVMDLVTFYIRFENIVAPPPRRMPFYSDTFPYADMNPRIKNRLDLINYRCHALRDGGMNSNKNLIYEVPSYTGIMGYMPKRFARLVKAFGYPRTTIYIYPRNVATSERFLDLSAVRYSFNDRNHFVERKSALARLNKIYDYKVVEDDGQLLGELRSDQFYPQKTVLLSQDPGTEVVADQNRMAQMVPILDATTDQVSAEISGADPALLLFVESFDEGWKAFVDGRPVPIYRANYNFMACVVPAGNHRVAFKYLPESYFVSLKVTIVGILILVAGSLILAVVDTRRNEG